MMTYTAVFCITCIILTINKYDDFSHPEDFAANTTNATAAATDDVVETMRLLRLVLQLLLLLLL